MSTLLTTGLRFSSTIWTSLVYCEPNDCNLSGHHVISLLEQPGTLRTNIGLLLIYHQTTTTTVAFKCYVSVIQGSRKVYFLPFKRISVCTVRKYTFCLLNASVYAPLFRSPTNYWDGDNLFNTCSIICSIDICKITCTSVAGLDQSQSLF